MPTDDNSQDDPCLDDRDRIQVLLEEYRALYDLLRFRLEAMDQRLPLVGGVFVAVLGSLPSMPPEAERILLLALPAGVVWLGLMTIAHARSKEDIKRRIDEVELRVNDIAGEELMTFQSGHPDRFKHVGGRTGMSAVYAIVTVCLAMLAACAYLFGRAAGPTAATMIYAAFVASVALFLLYSAWNLRRYRYPGRTPPRAAGGESHS